MYIVGCFVTYLVLSIAITVWVARTLDRNGRVFVVDAFRGNAELADSVNHLLVVWCAWGWAVRLDLEDNSFRGYMIPISSVRLSSWSRTAILRELSILPHPTLCQMQNSCESCGMPREYPLASLPLNGCSP
jgi:hypothetical protein